MNRKDTIKKMREIIRILKDDSIFVDSDFFPNDNISSKVNYFIKRKLEL